MNDSQFPIEQVKCSHCGKINHLYVIPYVDLDCWNCHEQISVPNPELAKDLKEEPESALYLDSDDDSSGIAPHLR